MSQRYFMSAQMSNNLHGVTIQQSGNIAPAAGVWTEVLHSVFGDSKWIVLTGFINAAVTIQLGYGAAGSEYAVWSKWVNATSGQSIILLDGPICIPLFTRVSINPSVALTQCDLTCFL